MRQILRGNHMRNYIFLLASLIPFTLTPGLYAKAGDAGELLNFGVTARALGLANAMTSVTGDATSIYYNPGGIGRMQQKQLSFTHATLFQDTSFDYVGYGHSFKKNALAFGIVRLGSRGGIGKTSANTPTGDFDFSETAYSIGWGRKGLFKARALYFGGAFKMVRRDLGGYGDSLYALDLGVQYGPFIDKRMNLGLVLKNIGSFSGGDTDDKLSLQSNIGLDYKLTENILTALEVGDLKDVALGMEYYWGPLSLRMGYSPPKSAAVANLPIGGMGFKFRSFEVDYAMSNRTDLGGFSHHFTFGFNFGASRLSINQSLAEDNLAKFSRYFRAGEYKISMFFYEKAMGLIYPEPIKERYSRMYQNVRKLILRLNLEKDEKGQNAFRGDEEYSVLARQSVSNLFDGNREKAMMLAQSALGSKPESIILQSYLRLVEDETGLRSHIDETVPLDKLIKIKLKKAEKAFLRREFVEAIDICQEILMIDANNALAYTRMGSSLFLIGEKRKAYEAYQKALTINPDDQLLIRFIEKHFK